MISGTMVSAAAAALRDALHTGTASFDRRRAMAPIDLSVEDLEDRILCFGGEFGYEILSWLPYLNYVVSETGAKLKTCSRPGSSALYAFSAQHTEVPFTWRPESFGTRASDSEFRRRFGEKAVSVRGPWKSTLQEVSLGGVRWEHQRIHSRLKATNFRRLILSAPRPQFLPHDAPIAVINNKSFDNWGNTDLLLRESFDEDQLIALRDTLLEKGYFVVYHRFEEPVPEERFALHDEKIFVRDGTFDMRSAYADCASAGEVMELQLGLYAAADLAICPQGGNSFLPIMFSTPTVVLSTHGRIVEYQDLGALYSTSVDVHTSPDSILEALRWVPRFQVR